MRPAIVLLIALGATVPANADVERYTYACDSGLCVHWWPKVAVPAGWQRDEAASRAAGILALVPRGQSFDSADTVMYAAAVPKGGSDTHSLDELIANDRRQFERHAPEAVVLEVKPLATARGAVLRSFTYLPKDEGKWERVSYGEEGGYYLVITLSSATQAGYEKALPAYLGMTGGL